MDGEAQRATSQISEMDTPLDHAQEEAMPLVEWALTPMGHCKPKEKYAKLIASTNHLEIPCFVTGPPLARLPKPTKSCSDFPYEVEQSMYTLRALTGQSGEEPLIQPASRWLLRRRPFEPELVDTLSHDADELFIRPESGVA